MEKNRRKRWIAGALAFVMCCTTLFSAGTAAATAGTDGTYQEQTEASGEKSEEELFLEIEADPELALTIMQGDPFEIGTDFTGLKLAEDDKAELKKAAMEDGREFDPGVPGVYKCVYQVTPKDGGTYLIARNITVSPREAETPGSREGGSEDSGGAEDGEADAGILLEAEPSAAELLTAESAGGVMSQETVEDGLTGGILETEQSAPAAEGETVPGQQMEGAQEETAAEITETGMEEQSPEETDSGAQSSDTSEMEEPGDSGEAFETEAQETSVPSTGTESFMTEDPATEPETGLMTEPETEPAAESGTEVVTESVTEPGTELTTEPGTETGSESQTEPSTELATESESETEAETESESESESESEMEGEYEVSITKGGELGVTLDHEDGSYDAGETVVFSTNLPAGSLTAAGALKEESNAKGGTADLLYSEVTYHADTDTFSFEMPAEDIALEVAADYAEGGIMMLAASEDTPWDEATEIEANTYYYYSDGKLHPFNSAMGSGGNDSYKYVRYKANGKTYTVNAYCMQHSMASPPSGTTYKNMVELDEGGDDKYLRKALFYGYGGPGWGKTFNGHNIQSIMEAAGCSSETRAMQHYLVDYLYDGESGFGGALSSAAKEMLRKIKAALKEMPDPANMKLLPALSVTANGRDTETFTWKANQAFKLTIHLEDGVSLVNETTGETGTGNVTVKGGDQFHLTATTDNVSSLKGKYEVTSNYPLDFHAMLLKLQSSQDIGFGYYTDSSGISLSVEWPEQAQLNIIKQDAVSGAKLAGAVYGVYSDEACQNLITEMPPTDADGASSVMFNVTGSIVYLKEITPPQGYKRSVEAVGVTVAAGTVSTQTVTDTEGFGGLRIYKEGEVLTGAVSNADGTTFQYEKRRLAGAVYSVTAAEPVTAADGRTVYEKGAEVASNLVTGLDGMVSVKNLYPGKYLVTEIGAPQNYINKGEGKEVTVTVDGEAAEAVFSEVSFENDRQKAEVDIVKEDQEASSPLAGGVFALYAGSDIKNVDGAVSVPKDTLIGKATTGSDGHGKFSADLPVGYSYYVKEVQAPDGFLLNTEDVYHFSFAYTGEKEAVVKFLHTFTNEEPRASLTIYKEGEVLTGAVVADEGVTFQYEARRQKDAVYDVYAGEDIKTATGRLIYQKGALVAGDLVTGDDGSVTISGLYLGTYTVKEKRAPENFVNKGEAKSVTLSYNGQTEQVVLGTVTIHNDRQKARVTVAKADDTTKNPLPGGIYGLYAGEDIKNADGKAVVQKGTLISKVTTGADGTGVFSADIPVGYGYYVKELQAPEKYFRNEKEVYEFTFSYTNDKEAVAGFTHTFQNERVNAVIHLVKKDQETGGKPQGDAVFTKAVYGLFAREDIVHPDGKTGVLFAAGTQVATLTTDEKGNAQAEDLYLGKYYIKELTPPAGYLLDEQEHDLECSYEGDLVKTVERTAVSPEQVIKQPFQLIKAADNGKTDADLLKGAGFSAYLKSSLPQKKDGSYDFTKAEPIVLTADGRTEMFTDEKGYACSIPVPYGTYVVRETTTPHNFTPVEDFTVTISENKAEPQVWRVLLDDEFQAKLKIVKKDDETKQSVLLPGTEFKVYSLDEEAYVEQVTTYPETTVHSSYFTDENGYLILPNALDCGNYRIEEVTAPGGYTLNTGYVTIKVDSNTAYEMEHLTNEAVITVAYENHPVKGKLVIKKTGEVLKSFREDFTYEEGNLAGAEFAVYAAETIYSADHQTDGQGNRHVEFAKDTLVTSVTTDENGEAVVDGLPLGKYRVTETKAPYGYVLGKAGQEVEFVYEGQNTPVVEHEVLFNDKRQKVKLSVEKQDAETQAKVKGAEFALYNKEEIKAGDEVLVEADTLLQKAESNENGLAAFTLDLPLGKYYVKEIKAPDGYVSSDEVLEFDASYQGQEVPAVKLFAVKKNEPTVTEFTKADITSGAELSGASLSVLDEDGDVVDSWTSVKDEPHVIKRLVAGRTYTLREEFAPYGYLRAEKVQFTVSDTMEVQKVKMEDAVPKARLIVNKKGEFLDKVTLLDDAAGAVEHFFGYVSGNLTQVTFEVYAAEAVKAADGVSADYYAADELVATITTDGSGIAQADDLPAGRYYVKEAATEHGYVLDEEPRYVDLTYRDQDTPVIVYDEDWQNNRQRVQVDVLKKEKGTDRVLSGTVFGLYTKEDIVSARGNVLLEADTLIEQKTTDPDGRIHFVADLPVDGTYYIKELTAPAGFVNAEETQEFVFDYQGDKVSQASWSFTFEDEPTTVELSKADLTTGKELPGATLAVLDEDGRTVEEWVSEEQPHIIRELTVGRTYRLVERIPANGYATAESVEFTVENTAELQKHVMEDDVTKVEISKTDITDSEELPGAKLTILDKDGKVVESWISGEKPHRIEKLPIGSYTLREEQAPKGYLIAEDVEFEVKDTGELQKVEMKDGIPCGRLILKKTDADSKAPIKGVEFELRKKGSKKAVEKLVTDEHGTARSGELTAAAYEDGILKETVEYVLVETKAAPGYEASGEEIPILFEYLDDQTKEITITKELTNKKAPETTQTFTPRTGDDTNIWLPVFLMLLSIGGIAGVVWYRKKKK